MIRTCRYVWIVALVLAPYSLLPAQTLSVTRSNAAYTPAHKLDPAKAIDPANFAAISQRQYVVVEGYINYIAQFPKLEGDGDFHFEMQRTATVCGIIISRFRRYRMEIRKIMIDSKAVFLRLEAQR